MKTKILLLGIFGFGLLAITIASEESKTWEASDKAKKFVEETIIIGFFVRSIRDIEAAHIRGNTTAVVWNSQTSTILNGDLSKVAALKEMSVGSMILSYNDLFRAGAGCLAEFNGNKTGVTTWGLAIIDEMVKHGMIVDLSHMGPTTTHGIMDYMDEKDFGE